MKKIMIGINTLTAVEQPVYANHIQFFYRLGKTHPDWVFATHTPRRMSIDRMRNATAKLALENDFDYIMFIDDDVIIPIDALDKLLALDKDIAAGWTIIRGHPFQNMFFIDDGKNGLKTHPFPVPEGVIDVDAVGFSCALLKCSLLKKINPPYFVTGPFNTEDIYFCVKAQQLVPDVTIVVDTSVKTFHGVGMEFVGPENREAYKKYVEEAWPELSITDDGSGPGDRGDSYLKMIE